MEDGRFFNLKVSLFIYLMSIKDIITVPDETLKKISDPLERVSTNAVSYTHLTLPTILLV